MENFIAQAVSGGVGSPQLNGPASPLGQDQFMKLLVAQLQNQDPLSPLDNTEFVAQLAQFSTLEGITNMGTSLDTVNNYMLSLNNFNATGLIGKDVKAYGNNISLNDAGTAELGYSLKSSASTVETTIYDESGSMVRTIGEGPKPAGANTLQWDGRDTTGKSLPAGKYTFTVAGATQDGSSVMADTIQIGKVDGVVYEGGIPYLMIGNSKIGMSEVLEIRGGV